MKKLRDRKVKKVVQYQTISGRAIVGVNLLIPGSMILMTMKY